MPRISAEATTRKPRARWPLTSKVSGLVGASLASLLVAVGSAAAAHVWAETRTGPSVVAQGSAKFPDGSVTDWAQLVDHLVEVVVSETSSFRQRRGDWGRADHATLDPRRCSLALVSIRCAGCPLQLRVRCNRVGLRSERPSAARRGGFTTAREGASLSRGHRERSSVTGTGRLGMDAA